MTEPERLVLVERPLEGESFVSWMQAAARKMLFSLPDFMTYMDIPVETSRRDLLLRLEPQWLHNLAAATGFDEAVFQGMTLDGWATALGAGRRTAAAIGLGGSTIGRFCRLCLRANDNRWPLSWHTPWAFYCLEHDTFLALRMPKRVLRMWRIHDDLSEIAELQHWHEGPSPAARIAQTWLDARLASADASDVLTALHLLSARLVRADISTVADSLGEPYRSEVRFAQLADHGPERGHARQGRVALTFQQSSPVLTVAAEWTRRVFIAPSLPESTEALRAELEAELDSIPCPPQARLQKWGGLSPTLTAAALPLIKNATPYYATELQFRLGTPTAKRPDLDEDAVHERARRTSTALWPAATASLWRPEYGALRAFRRAASTALLHIGARFMTRDAAHDELSTPGGLVALTKLAPEDRERVLLTLVALADEVDARGVVIDYSRRRSMSCDDLLPEGEWAAITDAERWRAPTWSHAAARVLLQHLIIGDALSYLPARGSDLFARVPRQVYEGLVDSGERWLRSRGIVEPLTAQPKVDAADIPWDPSGSRGADVRSLRLELNPGMRASRTPWHTRRWRFSEQALRLWYQDQHLTTYQIGERLHLSAPAVQRHLDAAGINRRPRGGGSRPVGTSLLPVQDLPMVAAATATQGGLTRIKRFVTAMQYPTVTAAARELGVTQAVLTVQLQELERDVGVALYLRAERGRPQQMTSAGGDLIRQYATLQERAPDVTM